MSRRSLTGCLAVALLAAPLLRAAAPQFWRLEGGRDFLEGETDAVSIDSDGQLRLAPASRLLHDPEAPYVWAVAQDGKGNVYAGTGNEGKLYRIDAGGQASVLFDAPEMEIHAVASGRDGKIYVATSPDGQVYAVEPGAHFETFYDPPEKYIWALAFDARGRLLVGTGADGKVHRVDSKGKAEVVFASPETHITSLASDPAGNVYAGSAPSGVLYRIGADDKVFVLYDSPYREVKAIDVGAEGSIYASLIDAQPRPEAPGPAPTPAPAAPGTPVVEVSEVFTAAFYTAAPGPVPTPAPGAAKPAGAKGAILRVLPTGELDTLWTSSDETPFGIAVMPDGLLVGTGDRGRLFRVRDDRSWTMVSALPSEELTALARGPKGQVVVAGSNPGKVWSLEGAPSPKGTFTSKVKDTDTVSTWGRLSWDATLSGGEIQVQTRSGNTASPDTTWSDWSPPLSAATGSPVESPRARFLQIRATLSPGHGETPVVDGIRVAYLQRNLRPQIVQFQAHPAGEVYQRPLTVAAGEVEILGLEVGQGDPIRALQPKPTNPVPATTAYARKLFQRGLQTFSWKAEDPNGDLLTYELAYRPVGGTRWTTLRKGVAESVLAWDTTTVPNGRYLVRLSASDQPSNPEGLALAADRESTAFDVDNVPPAVAASVASRSPLTVRAEARDADSPIRRADWSVDAGRWQEVAPTDGINDSPAETYEIVLKELAPGPHVVVVRAMDMLGNVSAARIEVK